MKEGAGNGRVHAVLLQDPSIDAVCWVTRCGWHFGLSDHALLGEEAPPTCKRCRVSEGPGQGSR